MNVQAEKLELITWLAQLQDVNLLEKLKEFRRKAEVEAYEASLKPMTVEELIARSRASDEDIAAGRVHDLEDVMKELLD
jgi:phosphoenolpyruvate-protein kinase (PTS system EI component)